MKTRQLLFVSVICCALVALFSTCKKNDDNTSACNGLTSMTDADGNTYNVVEIGSQCWMQENLRVSAGIAEVADSAQWANIYNDSLQTPAWCYYDNNSANAATYGKLYNWYAVNTGSLCPSGWHIPTDEEWKTLEMSLGMSQAEADEYGLRGDSANVGGQLKATTLWNSPNTGATNSSGFTALPGGAHTNPSYNFIYVGDFGFFWSSSEYSTGVAWARTLGDNVSGVYRVQHQKLDGFSCRCLRD